MKETFNNSNIPLRNGKLWKYCSRCGKIMTWIHSSDSYDRTTGEYGPNYSWRCPTWVAGERTKDHDCSNTTVRSPRETLSQ